MNIKICDKCEVTSEQVIVIRYPTGRLDETVNYCDYCAQNVGYTFPPRS